MAGGDRPGGVTAGVPDGAREAVDLEGAAPVAAEVQQAVLNVWHFAPDTDPRRIALDLVPNLVIDDANFVWIDLSGYAVADLRQIATLLGLHQRAVRTALSPWQRPRLASYGDHLLVSVTVAMLTPGAYRMRAAELDLFVGRNYLVSVHKAPLSFGTHLQARALASPELVALDSAFMLYLVLDELLGYYEELNRTVQGAVETLEERALRDTSDAFLEDLLRFKRYAFALSQLADHHREVFAAFLRPDMSWVSGEEVESYYEELQDRLVRLLDALNEARDDVNGAFDIYVSHMTHRTNAVIKVLTIVSTILFSVSVVISLFGTTLQGIGTYGPLGFVVMVACIVVVCLAIIYAFRRQRWI